MYEHLITALVNIQRRAQNGNRTFDQAMRDLAWIDDEARLALALVKGAEHGSTI